MAGIHRAAADQGGLPSKKLAAIADLLRQILARSRTTSGACATGRIC